MFFIINVPQAVWKVRFIVTFSNSPGSIPTGQLTINDIPGTVQKAGGGPVVRSRRRQL